MCGRHYNKLTNESSNPPAIVDKYYSEHTHTHTSTPTHLHTHLHTHQFMSYEVFAVQKLFKLTQIYNEDHSLLIGAMVCLLAAPWVQLSVRAGNGWPHNALRHHWLMPFSCHFRDCTALLVTSLTHVSGAIASVQTFTFTFLARGTIGFTAERSRLLSGILTSCSVSVSQSVSQSIIV